MTTRPRSTLATTHLREHRAGPGFTSFSLRGIPGATLDPFLNLDDFRMSEPTFPPHPHAGFSAVTYMFEDSPGTFTNRDSLGDESLIGPGTLHWTQAARGMMHEEIPQRRGVECHGLQMFVNLRSDHKLAAPRAFHVDARYVPECRDYAGARIRVLAGSLAGVRSALSELLTPVSLFDVHLRAGARVSIPVAAGTSCFVLSISGSGTSGPERAAILAHDAFAFADDGDAVELAAGSDGLHVLLAAGKPLGEPVVFAGPFAMTTRTDAEAAIARYERGEMGRLSRSF
jgi:redox-sensitive bicupin YhaK (pirin superfamily)